MKNTTKKFATLSALAAALFSSAAFAQVDPLTTTGGWKTACELSADNTVTISQNVKVNIGYRAGYPEQVSTGCTINLLNGAALELERTGLRFAGPLTINGSSKSGIAMNEGLLSGSATTVNLGGSENFIQMNSSRIDAHNGNLIVAVGFGAKFEIDKTQYGGVPATNASFAAPGDVNISANFKLSSAFKETGLFAGRNLTVNFFGQESEMKFENSGALATGGNVSIVMGGGYSKAEYSNSGLRAPAGNLTVKMSSGEVGLSLSNTVLNASGNILLHAVGGKSNLNMSNGEAVAGGSLTMLAATSGNEGYVKAEDVRFRAGGIATFASGFGGGTTFVKNAVITPASIDVRTGFNGKCEAKDNTLTAPVQSICP